MYNSIKHMNCFSNYELYITKLTMKKYQENRFTYFLNIYLDYFPLINMVISLALLETKPGGHNCELHKNWTSSAKLL